MQIEGVQETGRPMVNFDLRQPTKGLGCSAANNNNVPAERRRGQVLELPTLKLSSTTTAALVSFCFMAEMACCSGSVRRTYMLVVMPITRSTVYTQNEEQHACLQ